MKITYRPLEKTDLESVFKLTSNRNVARFMRFGVAETMEEAEKILDGYLAEISFAVLADGEFAGVFSFKKTVNEDVEDGLTEGVDEKSISIFVDEAFWGKGVFSGILPKMLSYAKENKLCKKLTAFIIDENVGSVKVCGKNGFTLKKSLSFPDLTGTLLVFEYLLY